MKAILLTILVIFVSACASRPHRAPLQASASAEPIVDLSLVAGDFVWRQSITAEYASRQDPHAMQSGRFEAVLQKQGSVLTVVGLTPLGTRAFVAVQNRTHVKVTEGDESRLPFPPRFVFLDINRCFFIGPAQAQADGWHEYEAAGERVKDLWKAGLLMQRTLNRAGDANAKQIIINYEGGQRPGGSPGDVHLNNLRFGYRLKIHTLEAQNL